MKPPTHRHHPPAGQGSDEQLPGMALDGGNRKPRDLAVGDPRLHRHLVREPPEPRAQDDRDLGNDFRPRPHRADRLVDHPPRWPRRRRAQPRHLRLTLAPDAAALPRDLALRGPRLFAHAPRLGPRLTHDDLGFALGRRARLLAELLRRDERLVHRALSLPVHAQLLPERRQPLLEHRLLAQDALELIGDAHAEVLDAERLVAAQAATELLLAHIVRREMEGVAAHCAIAPGGPNSAVPKRITVAPSSTARP